MGSRWQNTSTNNSGFPPLKNAAAEGAQYPFGCALAQLCANTKADMHDADPFLGPGSHLAGPARHSGIEWSGSQAENEEIEPCLCDLPRHWLGQNGPPSTVCASSHFDPSILPSHLRERILSKLPVEQQIQWLAVCETWKELFPSDRLFNMYGPNSQPSTKNRPIFFQSTSVFRPREPSQPNVATYNSTLNVWQGRDMNYFMQTRPAGNTWHHDATEISTSGGLIYRYSSYKFTSTIMIEICNPVSGRYRSLERREDAQNRRGLVRKFRVWGIIIENHLNRYQVIVQNWMVSGGATISQLLMYDSAADLWETVGPLAQGISDRVGDVYSSTSSGGNLYFLTADLAAGCNARKRPRLIKYDGADKSIRELVPLPNFVGRGEPGLLEHKGDIIFVTRKRIQLNSGRRTTWVFFRLDKDSQLFVQIRVMPRHELTTLCRNIKIDVRCHGNGDRVYFYGTPTIFNPYVMKVLVHDFVKNSWTWLTDFQLPGCSCGWDLVSITPSFMKI